MTTSLWDHSELTPQGNLEQAKDLKKFMLHEDTSNSQVIWDHFYERQNKQKCFSSNTLANYFKTLTELLIYIHFKFKC